MSSKNKRWPTVPLSLDEFAALRNAASVNQRLPRQQAAHYIKSCLERDGHLPQEINVPCPHCGEGVGIGEGVIALVLGTEPLEDVNKEQVESCVT